MDVFEIPLVGIGSLRHGSAIVGAVPWGVDVGAVPHKETPSIVDENLEFRGLTASSPSEAVVLWLVGSEDVGKPDGTNLWTESDGGVATAVILVARVECEGDGVWQGGIELPSGTLSMEDIAVGECPCGMVSVGRAVVEGEDRVVEIYKVAVGLKTKGWWRCHFDGDGGDDIA